MESIFEADAELHADPAGALSTLRSLGVTRVKVYLPWRALAPTPDAGVPPASFNASDPAAYPATAWAPYDAIIRQAASDGVGVDLTLGGPPPLWAAGPGAPPGPPRPQWKPSAADFGAFVRAVGRRYSGTYSAAGGPLPRVSFWALWNEPNYGPDLAPQAIGSTVEIAPALYRSLLDAAWSALQATGHGHDTVLIGELAPRGITTGDNPGNFSGMVPLRFVRALYCVNAQLHPLSGPAATARGCPATSAGAKAFAAQNPVLFQASGFSIHPYPQGRVPPDVATPGEPDYADLPALPRLESLLDAAQSAYGTSKRFPLYSTEFGYQTNPPERIVRAVDTTTAALYLNWAEYLSWRDPRILSYDQYLLRDAPTAGAAGGFATGLEAADGTPKPTLDAFRLPLFLPHARASSGDALEVWGCVRPAPYAQRDSGHTQSVAIEFAPAGGAFRALRRLPVTDPGGYFDLEVKFPSSGQVRLAYTYPHGPTVYSRTATVTVT